MQAQVAAKLSALNAGIGPDWDDPTAAPGALGRGEDDLFANDHRLSGGGGAGPSGGSSADGAAERGGGVGAAIGDVPVWLRPSAPRDYLAAGATSCAVGVAASAAG